MPHVFYFIGGLVALAAVFGIIVGKPLRRGLGSPDPATRDHVNRMTSGASGLDGRYSGPGGFGPGGY